MARGFRYVAQRADGSRVEGVVEASNAAAAANQVLEIQLLPLQVGRSGDRGGTTPVESDAAGQLVAPHWRIVGEDGRRVAWTRSRSSRLLGAGLAVTGLIILAALWLWWRGGTGDGAPAAMSAVMTIGWWFSRIVGTLFALSFLILGVVMMVATGKLWVDRTTGTLQMMHWGRRTLRREQVREVAVERRYYAFSSGSGDAMPVQTYLARVPTVRVVSEDGSAVDLEQCSSADHAGELAAKVAEYLNVPYRNMLQ